ncbi:MAG: hypothetical protein K0Q74_492 [Gammaproteobacteria bacterium]|nr:hypothetical protein [Gammaproteobacteria bacterium]
MAQMAGSETNVFGSAGAALVSKGMEYLGEVMSLSKTYTNDQDRRRLRVLQDIYVRHHDEIPNNLGVDKETNKPPEVFISGDWEQHCSERLRGKEIGSLRVDIEDILAVIANFLDDRRKYLGSVSSKLYDVYKGDIEELFFAEVIDWVVRCLDCNANDNLIKIIERKILYLTNVMDDLEVFPKQTVHDKSQAFEVIRTINEMLGKLKQKVKTIHDKKFLLNKFEHVANVSEVFLAHFIKGFANFSPKLRRIKAATKENILSVAKKTNTRYEGLFVMFLENAFIRECGSVEELSEDMRKNAGLEFDASNFQKLMADEARDRGILMPDELWKLIPHIFVVAYNLSISMKLINHAISTLSERGTANLFCNSEGGLYFNFLIFDFQRDMAMLYGMLEEFNRGSAGYKCDTYQNTRQQLSKTSELGQHKRFQDIFKNIQSQYEQLNACLQETSHKIREFEGISSEASLKNKRLFYATLRERMVVKGDTVLAERLRCIADAGGLIELEPEAKQEMLATVLAEQDNREMVSDAGASIGISKVVPNGIEAVQLDVIGRRLVGGQKSCVPGRQSDTVAAVTYVQSRHEWPILYR